MNPQGGGVYCYHFDATGNTVALTDQSGAIANTYAYKPYGEMTPGQTQTVNQPFTYVGQYGVMAEPYGYYYMRARYYDSGSGRFVSEDPLGFGGGDVNLYGYVRGNPVNGIDPSGTIPVPVITGLIGAGIGAAANAGWQLYHNNGFNNFSYGDLAIAAGVGGAAGAIAPLVSSTGGAVALNAAAGFGQYALTEAANGRDLTLSGSAWALGTGTAGGAIAGTFYPIKGLAWDTSGKYIDQALAKLINDREWVKQNVTLASFIRAVIGGMASNSYMPCGN